jgi:hypothetical protein
MRKPKTRPEITEPRDYALSTLGYPTMRALPLFDAAGSRPKEQLIRANACPCRKIKLEHIGGVVHAELAMERRDLRSGPHAESARPSSTIGECELRRSMFGTN